MLYKRDEFETFADKELEVSDPNILARKPDLQLTWPIRLMESAREKKKLVSALLVIVNTPHIQEYLREKDPKALQQSLDALHAHEAGNSPREQALALARDYAARAKARRNK